MTTFNLPDYRGRFLRGLDSSGEGRDPDLMARYAMNPGGATQDNVGSIQDDNFKSHSHLLRAGTSATQALHSGDKPWARPFLARTRPASC